MKEDLGGNDSKKIEDQRMIVGKGWSTAGNAKLGKQYTSSARILCDHPLCSQEISVNADFIDSRVTLAFYFHTFFFLLFSKFKN